MPLARSPSKRPKTPRYAPVIDGTARIDLGVYLRQSVAFAAASKEAERLRIAGDYNGAATPATTRVWVAFNG